MRRLPLIALSLLAVSAQAGDKMVESSAALALTLSYTDEATEIAGRNSTTTQAAVLKSFRLGNREILETLLADGWIDEIRGWRVVAVWAHWTDEDPYAGNAYRFYARRGKGAAAESVAIPSGILSIEPVMPTVGYSYALNGETITGGTEKFTIYQHVTFGIAGHAGLLVGLETGSGRYVKVAGSDAARYLPNASKATLQGTYSDDGEYAAGVGFGTLSFGGGKLVPASDYGMGGEVIIDGVTIQSATGSTTMTNLGADFTVTAISGELAVGLTNTGSGTLVLGDNTFTTGATVINGTISGAGDLTVPGATYVINGGSFFPGATGSSLVFSSGEVSNPTNPDIPLTFSGGTSLDGFTFVDLSATNEPFTISGAEPFTFPATLVPLAP